MLLRLTNMVMYGRQWGTSGPDIVLVHGHVVSSRYMVKLGEALGQRFRVYATDLPGSGRSERPPRALSIRELADTLDTFITERSLDQPALLGNSMGCQVICDLVARKPVASRLVLQGPTIDSEARKLNVMLGRFFRSAMHERRLLPLARIYLWDLWTAGFLRSWDTLQFALGDRPEIFPTSCGISALCLPAQAAENAVTPKGCGTRWSDCSARSSAFSKRSSNPTGTAANGWICKSTERAIMVGPESAGSKRVVGKLD